MVAQFWAFVGLWAFSVILPGAIGSEPDAALIAEVREKLEELRESNRVLAGMITSYKQEMDAQARSNEENTPQPQSRRLSELGDEDPTVIGSAELTICTPAWVSDGVGRDDCPKLVTTASLVSSNLTITAESGSVHLQSAIGSHFTGVLHADSIELRGVPLGGMSVSGANLANCDSVNTVTLSIGGFGSVELPTGCTQPPAFPSIKGCTDSRAGNYFASASVDEGNCIYFGCLDTTALNFDATANTHVELSCVEAKPGCTNPQGTNYLPSYNVDDGSCVILGCMDSKDSAFNPAATLPLPFNCVGDGEAEPSPSPLLMPE